MMDDITVDDIYAGKYDLPAGIFVTDEGIYVDKSRIKDKDHVLEFIYRITDYIPQSQDYSELLQIGNYLVATDKMPDDLLFKNSIIMIGPYRPFFKHVGGIGILEDHPSSAGFPGWTLEKLVEEVKYGFWEPMNKEEMLIYASEMGYDV